MAINIQTLFADIIDTPEQRQQKLLQQGMMQGQLLASGLRGRAAALAPLAQVAGQLGVQRQEDLRRAVQPMIGIDPRTTGEKLQEVLANIDPSTPSGLLEAANAVQSIDPVRAATLRQEAARLRKEEEDRAMAQRTEELRQLSSATNIASATQQMRLRETAEERAEVAADFAAQQAGLDQSARALEINQRARAIINEQNADANRADIAQSLRDLGSEYELYAAGIEGGSFNAIDVLPRVAAQELAKVKIKPRDYKPLTKTEKQEFADLAQEIPELKDAMSKGFLGMQDPIISNAKFYQLIAVAKQNNPSASPDQILNTVAAQIKTGVAAPINELNIEAMARQQAETGANYDPEAAAAAAAAQLGQTPASQAPPQQISKEDAQSLGYVPQGYTKMTSGLLQLTGDTSEDWAGGQFVDKQAQQQLQQEIEAEYLRINPTGRYNASAMTRARQNVMARNK